MTIINKVLVTLSFLVFATTVAYAQKVGINTTTPEATLDVVSSNSGVLLPRLNNTQIQNIPNAKEGLLVYNTSLRCLMVNIRAHDATGGTDWRCLLIEPRNSTVN